MSDTIMSACRCAGPDAAVCPACHQASLERSLRLLPRVYQELEEALAPQTAAVTRTSGGGPRLGIPLNGRAVDARRAILGTLATWAEVVVEGRRLARPRRTVPALAAFLDCHARWLAAHPAAQDAATELDSLLKAARRAAPSSAARRISVGPCVVDGCGGGLTAVLGHRQTAAAASVDCDRDGTHSWPPQRWLELCGEGGEERGTAGQKAGTATPPSPGLTTAQIARTWRISTGTVYWLASTHGWKRSRHGREVRYAHQDVLRSLGNR
ncbi:helix-turn-helix domain-containing protein [Streptomyces sp. NPDC059063]|uniref:helix-turn-helix domain-containing protein n=1 Tax=unclassified Streptomyces TaxID=2593676 RepID=UPI00369CFEC9